MPPVKDCAGRTVVQVDLLNIYYTLPPALAVYTAVNVHNATCIQLSTTTAGIFCLSY